MKVSFVASALVFAATSTAQAIALAPNSTIKLAFSVFPSSCLGALSLEVGAEVILDPCSTLPFSTFKVLDGGSASSGPGVKFQLVGSADRAVCMSARGATDAVPMMFDVCEDDVLQLFEFTQPDDELVVLSDTGSCLISNKASATLAPCAPQDPFQNGNQQWLPIAA